MIFENDFLNERLRGKESARLYLKSAYLPVAYLFLRYTRQAMNTPGRKATPTITDLIKHPVKEVCVMSDFVCPYTPNNPGNSKAE